VYRFRRALLAAALAGLALALVALAFLPPSARAPTSQLVAAPSASITRAPATASPTHPPPSPTSAPTPTPQPQITVRAAAQPPTATFELRGQIPGGATEALLWYDTLAGHAVRRIDLRGERAISASVAITPTQEGLTLTEQLDAGLDYWWAVRDTHGALVRRSGNLALPPAFAELARTSPITAPEQIDWIERATPHFRLLAPPDSAAARDIDALGVTAEDSYAQAAAVISATQAVSISIYLLPRVFWQGGVAYGAKHILAISYLDRNYTGVTNSSYFVHEITHALAGAALPQGAEIGGLLGEGLAVYATGGHYGREPIDAWAAVLAESDQYVPLCELRYDFYAPQHEVAYQEGASFVAYLIRTYGVATFQQIFAAQQPQRGDHRLDLDAFCAADRRMVVEPTGKTTLELEQDWLGYLKTVHPTEEQRRAWDLMVRFFDTMRRYQEAFDPPARDLPPPMDGWDRATAAKFLNAASGKVSAILETMLGATLPAIQRGELDRATALLGAIETSLDAGGLPNTALARDYDAIVQLLAAQARALRLGDQHALAATLATPDLAAALPFTPHDLLHDLRYTPAQLDVRGDTATGVVQVDGASLDGRQLSRALYRIQLARSGGIWRLESCTPLVMASA
jgi:hypothetical protein